MPTRAEQLYHLGRAIRLARVTQEISQEALALRIGTHANHIGAIERGEKDLRASTLLRIADGLDVPLSEIVRIYEERVAKA